MHTRHHTPDLSVAQLARRLHADHSTIVRWIQSSYFPNAYKLNPAGKNSPYRIPECDVLAFEASRLAQDHAQNHA